MSMSPEVRAEYNKILATVVAYNGYALKVPCTSMFMQYDYDGHIAKCGIKAHSEPREDTWYEFQGTFADDHSVHGVTVQVTCNCGRYVDREVRWRTNVSEMMEAVFERFYEKMRVTSDE